MYSTREAAEILGLSQDHVKLLARKGIIDAKKLGRDWVGIELNPEYIKIANKRLAQRSLLK